MSTYKWIQWSLGIAIEWIEMHILPIQMFSLNENQNKIKMAWSSQREYTDALTARSLCDWTEKKCTKSTVLIIPILSQNKSYCFCHHCVYCMLCPIWYESLPHLSPSGFLCLFCFTYCSIHFSSFFLLTTTIQSTFNCFPKKEIRHSNFYGSLCFLLCLSFRLVLTAAHEINLKP